MVKKFIKKQYNSPLFRGGMIMFVSSFGVGALNYIFNIIVARILDKEQFGAFSSLFSLLTILLILGGGISLVLIKFSAVLYAKKDYTALANFIRLAFYYLGFASIGLMIIFGIASPFIYDFLKLESFGPLIILALSIGLALTGSVGGSVLKGIQHFGQSSGSSIVGAITKILALILFTLPFWPMSPVTGAMLSVPASAMIMIGLDLFFLKNILAKYNPKKPKLPHFAWRDVLVYSIPATIAVLGITMLNSIDVILARNYLSPEASGDYAALATLGKIIFFATSAIPMAMFPIVSARHAVNEPHRKMLFASLGVVGLMSLGAFGVYQFFSEFIITLLIGEKFLSIAPLLGKFALIMGMYSLVNVIVNYYLSIQKYTLSILPLLASIALIVMMRYSPSSVEQIVNTVFWNMTGLFIVTIVLSVYQSWNKKKDLKS
jgi:O-antigen/teichoic acid export membrane protein